MIRTYESYENFLINLRVRKYVISDYKKIGNGVLIH